VLLETRYRPNESDNDDKGISAPHVGIAQFGMCDGSVRPISENIDAGAYNSLGTVSFGPELTNATDRVLQRCAVAENHVRKNAKFPWTTPFVPATFWHFLPPFGTFECDTLVPPSLATEPPLTSVFFSPQKSSTGNQLPREGGFTALESGTDVPHSTFAIP